MSEYPSITLALSGAYATIEPDSFVDDSYVLTVAGTPQSHVNVRHPDALFFEYVRRIGHVVDEVRPPGDPITALHLGAGALTLPRYIEATRPGSRQQVIELERDLVDFVRQNLPWSKKAAIRLRYGDARDVAARLPEGIRGRADLIVSDIFSGGRTPAHVTSVEFYREQRELLAPDGILAANIADGPGLAFARSQAATMQHVFGNVAALTDTQLLKGRRFGNIVLIASSTPLPLRMMPRLLAGGPHPATLLDGPEMRRFAASQAIVTDATATASPQPSRDLFGR